MKLFKEMHGGGGRGLLLGMLVILGLMGTPVPPVTGDGVVTAKIMPASATLTPTTTFEVRFSSPMIEAVDVGEPIEISPLLLEPPLPGKFTWLSERSGVFTPEKPFALGQRYTVRLRGGLTGRAGGAVIAARRVFKTPPFEVAGHTFRESTFNRTSQPEFPIAFNDGVEAKRAVKHIRFRDRTGQAIAAKARPMTHREHRRVDAPSVGWRDRFHESHGRTLEPPTPDDVITTRLLVKPERPLPAGEWRLVVGRGLPSLMPGVATVKETVIKLGVVHPLKVNAVFAMNQLYRGRSLEILFNRRLSEDLKDGDPLRWIKIRPTRGPARKAPVPEIKAEVSDRAITLKGDFVLGGYEVVILDGLPGAENFSLADGRKEDVVFNMIQPRVFLPVWMDSQYANGHGKLRLLSLNNLDLRLRVKLVDPAHLPGTLESYRDGYFHRSSFNGRRWVHKEGRPLNFNLLPGRTLADFYTRFDEGVKPEVKRRGGEDDPAELEFNWKKLLGGRKTGVLFVQATSTGTDFRTQTSSQAIIQLTDLGVVWKSAGSPEVFAHVFSQTTGKPLPGASVELMTKENEVLAGGETDVHGTVTMAGGDRASWIRASLGDDTHILPMIGKGEVPLWQFKLNRRWGESENRRLLMFTDRGVYKPGETIHLKGILREVDGTDVNLPEKLNCRLRVVDARGEEVFNKNHPITKLGSFDFDVSIPNGPLGNYFLHVELTRLRQDEPNQTPAPPLPGVVPQPLPPLPGDGRASSSPSPRQRPVMRRMMTVQVAEYEPPKYKVDLRQDVEVVAGADAVVPLRARYYFGKPIAKAPVKWVLEGETAGFWPEEFDSYHFLDWSRGDVDEPGNFQLDGEGKLDSDGRMKIQPNLEINPNWPGPVGGRLRARVTDPTQQTITASTQVLKHSSDFYLGIKDMKRLQYLGKPAKIELIALGANEKPHKDGVEAKVILKRIEWRSVRVRGAGGTIDYRNEKNLITIAEETVAIRADDAKGTAIFHPKRSGQYLVEVRAKDSSDRPVRSSMQFYVPGPQPLAWDYRNEATIELVPDQKRYQPGDEAVILVKTPISGRALVTVEREKVLRSFQVELKGNAPAIHVPLQSGDAPNVFISVCLLRGAADSKRKVAAAEYRLGYCELEVEKTDGLNVELSLSQPEYRPGQEVKVTARILNIEGQPATHAEVTLFAINQGVLDLTGHRHPDPLEFFIRPIPLAVETYTSFPFMLTEDPAKAAFGNKGHLIGGGGKLASLRMRKNFLACAFWNANLRTDAEGRVRVQFKAPDGLTSYRVVAIVHTKDSNFGVADTSFRINKPLMIEAALPRFARTGDQIETRAVVFNQTQREREVVIDLKLSSNARIMDGQSTRKAIVAPGSSRAVMIPVEFIKTGECTADWRVAFSDEPGLGDALKTKLTIHHAAPLRREILLARIDGSEANLLKKADPQLLNGKGTVAVSISNTRLIELGEAADYLLTYPYGCVEQTSSGMLPWVILGSKRDAIPQINVPKAASRRAVQYGVRRLMSMQTPDGGLAYWPGGRVSMLWGSAYGAIALAHAELEGFRIPESALERLGDYLSRELRKKKENYHHYGLHDQCLSLYALALLGRPEPAYHEKMYQKRRHLTDPDRALLALAVQIANGPRDMAHVLLTDPGRKPLYGWFGCPSQSLAVQLLAWAHHDPNSEKVDRLLTQLLAGRKNGHWVTTQGNAWSVIALAAYADLVEGEPQAISGTIVWRGKNHPFALDGKNRSVRMNFQHADDGAEPVMELKNPANRRIYSNIRLETRTRLRITPRQNRGFSIRRSYSRLEENGKLNDAPEWRVGDLICVSLHLDVKEPGHYVAIDDPLPAVLEAMNPRFKTQQNAGEKKRTWDWMVSHTEIRADRMLYFVDHLPPGQHTFRYLARVRAPGKAIAAATKIEEMYHPDRHGVSASRDLTAQPLD